jgi:hypothetical protein
LLRGLAGDVEVAVDITRDPEELGAMPEARGLPHCHAVVDYPGQGYAGMLGWIQLVRSTDNSSGGERFEMDPLKFLGKVGHPFCFFGAAPTLFDAPARSSRADLDWLAYSFLGYLEDNGIVSALTGFSWGFTIAAGATTVTPPRPLSPPDWDRHRDLLHAEHPDWQFTEGFQTS